MVNLDNAKKLACHTVASHTARPEFWPAVLKWLNLAYRIFQISCCYICSSNNIESMVKYKLSSACSWATPQPAGGGIVADSDEDNVGPTVEDDGLHHQVQVSVLRGGHGGAGRARRGGQRTQSRPHCAQNLQEVQLQGEWVIWEEG